MKKFIFTHEKILFTTFELPVAMRGKRMKELIVNSQISLDYLSEFSIEGFLMTLKWQPL